MFFVFLGLALGGLRPPRSLGLLTDEVHAAMNQKDWPCPASGKLLEVCIWYFDFIKENPAPPKSLAGDLTGGKPAWHGPDPEIVAACEANHGTICVEQSPLCSEHH